MFFILQQFSLFTLLPLLLSTLFLIKWLLSSQRTLKNLPPSPKGLPIIGNLHQLGSILHRSLRSLAQKHGPLILLHLGRVPVLIVSSPDGAREIMKTHDIISGNRPHSKIVDKLIYGSKDITFSSYGEYWRQVKTIAVLHFLSTKRVNSYRHVRDEEVDLMVDRITKIGSSSNPLVNMSDVFMSLPNDVVCRTVTGRKYGEGDNGMKFKELLKEFALLLGVFKVGDYIPWLSFVDRISGLEARLDRNANGLDEILEGVISDHMEKNEGDKCEEDGEDFVDILLKIQKEIKIGFSIDKDTVKALILDMFAAGTDTTYAMLEWAMAELLRHPKIMKTLQTEIRETVQNRSKVTEDDLERMQYLKMVIKETLRLHPPLPILIPRESSQEIKVMGYDIPARTQVIINAWAIGRDASFWEDPEEFRPERFLNICFEYKGLNFEYIPFGAGRRGCPGILFALTIGELALANLVHKFDIALPNGTSVEDLDMTESSGLAVHMKSPLLVVATPH